jgi:hypothetical protein
MYKSIFKIVLRMIHVQVGHWNLVHVPSEFEFSVMHSLIIC